MNRVFTSFLRFPGNIWIDSNAIVSIRIEYSKSAPQRKDSLYFATIKIGCGKGSEFDISVGSNHEEDLEPKAEAQVKDIIEAIKKTQRGI